MFLFIKCFKVKRLYKLIYFYKSCHIYFKYLIRNRYLFQDGRALFERAQKANADRKIFDEKTGKEIVDFEDKVNILSNIVSTVNQVTDFLVKLEKFVVYTFTRKLYKTLDIINRNSK